MRTTRLLLLALGILLLGCQKDSMTVPVNPQDSGVDFRGAEKLLVCHNTGSETNTWELIEVAEIAYLKAHKEHGDVQPREAVPGMPGYKFGCNCEVEESAIATIVMNDDKTWTAKNIDVVPVNYEDQTWMAQDDQGAVYCEYGNLYSWDAAKAACQQLGNGWRLPTREDWDGLGAQYGTWDNNINYDAYEKLILDGDSGFDALLGGRRYFNGSFVNLGEWGAYWSDGPDYGNTAYYYLFDSNFGYLRPVWIDKAWGFSCRCVKD